MVGFSFFCLSVTVKSLYLSHILPLISSFPLLRYLSPIFPFPAFSALSKSLSLSFPGYLSVLQPCFITVGHLSFPALSLCPTPRSAELLFTLGILDKISMGTCSSSPTVSGLLLTLCCSLAWGIFASPLNSMCCFHLFLCLSDALKMLDDSFFTERKLLWEGKSLLFH